MALLFYGVVYQITLRKSLLPIRISYVIGPFIGSARYRDISEFYIWDKQRVNISIHRSVFV